MGLQGLEGQGQPIVDFLRQQDLVETLKRRELLPSYVEAMDPSLQGICMRISDIIRRCGVKQARRFVKERLERLGKGDPPEG